MVEKLKIGSIVIRCYEFDKMLTFWAGSAPLRAHRAS